ncbi:MAG: efflux RND transporter permease subunit [Gammaproteobacteria bacterium]|nr:efflux RND transporter permease subunit [Gammaproteobacteria bacterium]
MNIAEYSVTKRVTTWLLVILFLAGGISAYQDISRLEDPEFTIKDAKVYTYYPGATPLEVEKEVTYHLENAVQQMPQLKRVESISSEGFSEITVKIKDKYRKESLPQVWDELRRKINDARSSLPPGASPPLVVDDFGDVYGLFYALTGEGYSFRELKDFADLLKEQLLLVPGVAKIDIAGDQQEVVYLELSRENMAKSGVTGIELEQSLKSQNLVTDSGAVRVGPENIRINPTGHFQSVQEISNLLIVGSDNNLTRLGDIATVHRAYDELPDSYNYFNGEPALTIGISMLSGQNVVAVGERIDQRLKELKSVTPVGMQLHDIYNQPKIVEKSVNGFIVNVAQALIIVIVVLLFFMGLRTGLIIGAVLLLTVAGTLWGMNADGIALQRISLGALIIALGMLVDNAIVVAEGMLVRIKAGEDGVKVARDVVARTMWPLLGGTIVGIVAFAAIGLSDDSTGEFANSLFWVILISLLLSWFTAVTMTPLFCVMFLKPDKGDQQQGDPYGGSLFVKYKSMLRAAINHRWITLALVIGLFAISIVGFGVVKRSFFPNSSTPMFYFDMWEVEGTDIRQTRDDMLKIDKYLHTLEGVESSTTVVARGALRYTLVYSPPSPSTSFGQIIITTETLDDIPRIQEQLEQYVAENFPNTEPKTVPLRIGPGRDAKIEVRFLGPDARVLRQLSEQAQAIMFEDSNTKDIRDDWRQPVKVIRPIFNEQAARPLGITRDHLSNALSTGFEGRQIGLYRDGIRLLPIIVWPPEAERQDVNAIRDIPVRSPVSNVSVPVGQVVSGFETVWEDAKIYKRDRQRTITASCNPEEGLATPVFERLRPQIEAIPLPPGYKLEWGGEYEDSRDANAAIAKSLPMGFLTMIIIVIVLFGKVRQPLIIWLTVPLAIIGITFGLLITNTAFGFMGLLGALSLTGLLIKNAIVLIDEIDLQIDSGKPAYNAILDASVSRMRPVMMAASTTILGMIPLLSDVFFLDMAVTIMFGLGFASLLTLVVVPVLYATFFKVYQPSGQTTA